MRFLLFIAIHLTFYWATAQIEKPAHLFFEKEGVKNRKISKKDNTIDFYFGTEQFHIKDKDNFECLDRNMFNRVKLISIDSLLKMAERERIRLIREGEKKGEIKLLFNNEVFKTIFIYEIDENNIIIRYNNVIWVESIE